MTPEQLAAIPRQSAEEILVSIPLGPGYEHRLLLAVESALNLEWWRGHYAVSKMDSPSRIAVYNEREALIERGFVHVDPYHNDTISIVSSGAGATPLPIITPGNVTSGETPPYGSWCRDPKLCAGKGYCPRDPTCGD